MSKPATSLQERIASGKPLLIAEISPPQGADPAPLREMARRYAGKVHALGISDNRDRVSMAALAAAALVAAEGIEPILHVTTRDRNRIALVSEALGAQALGIATCCAPAEATRRSAVSAPPRTSTTSTRSSCSRPMPDWPTSCDACWARTASSGAGARSAWARWPRPTPIRWNCRCRGCRRRPRPGRRSSSRSRSSTWSGSTPGGKRSTRRGIHEKVAILAGIQPLGPEELAGRNGRQAARRRGFPTALIERVASKSDPAAQRAAAIEIALETIETLSRHKRAARLQHLSATAMRDAALDDHREIRPGEQVAVPAKYAIHTKPAAPRLRPVGKLGIVDWREDCSSCHNCVKRACIYGLYRDEADTLRDEIGYLDYIYQCKGCLNCVQNCTKNILTRVVNPEYRRLGDDYYSPDIILSTWFQAETGRIPVSGSGYGGPFSGPGFDSMWTDMSEIVRPTRDGIHGREYINTSVDIGRKLPRSDAGRRPTGRRAAAAGGSAAAGDLRRDSRALASRGRAGVGCGGRRGDRHAGGRSAARNLLELSPLAPGEGPATSFPLLETADAAATAARTGRRRW